GLARDQTIRHRLHLLRPRGRQSIGRCARPYRYLLMPWQRLPGGGPGLLWLTGNGDGGERNQCQKKCENKSRHLLHLLLIYPCLHRVGYPRRALSRKRSFSKLCSASSGYSRTSPFSSRKVGRKVGSFASTPSYGCAEYGLR